MKYFHIQSEPQSEPPSVGSTESRSIQFFPTLPTKFKVRQDCIPVKYNTDYNQVFAAMVFFPRIVF